jgi:hypothetical protein
MQLVFLAPPCSDTTVPIDVVRFSRCRQAPAGFTFQIDISERAFDHSSAERLLKPSMAVRPASQPVLSPELRCRPTVMSASNEMVIKTPKSLPWP